jgi:hypothetical protein
VEYKVWSAEYGGQSQSAEQWNGMRNGLEDLERKE